jgi:formylglycine-generating enzyme required for sulfatase activity
MSRLFLAALAGLVVGLLIGFVPASPNARDLNAAPTIDKADHKNYVEKVTYSKLEKKGDEDVVVKDSYTFDMVAVPGGTFTMGSPESEKGRNPDEGPQHQVKVQPFWIGKCEVTWDEFDAWWKSEAEVDSKNKKLAKTESDAVTSPTPPYVDETYGHEREKHPAVCMTHHAAMMYCEWLSKRTGKIYRLPTEAEWEYACRAGTTTAYCCGDDTAKLAEYSWYKANSPDDRHKKGTTHEVGTRKPNAFGIHDMHGNVMEWCLDHYQKDSYATFAKEKLSLWPVLVPTEKRFSHVARGGSWADEPDRLRSACRRASDDSWMKDDPNVPKSIWWLTKFDVIGLRVVRPVEEQDNLKGLKSKVTVDSD